MDQYLVFKYLSDYTGSELVFYMISTNDDLSKQDYKDDISVGQSMNDSHGKLRVAYNPRYKIFDGSLSSSCATGMFQIKLDLLENPVENLWCSIISNENCPIDGKEI